MQKEKVLSGQATAEQIARWKEEHKTVFTYTVEEKVAYFKPVDRNLYAAAMAKIGTSPAKFTEKIIDGTWLGGDEEIRKSDSYYLGLIDFVEEMMNKKKGELGKL